MPDDEDLLRPLDDASFETAVREWSSASDDSIAEPGSPLRQSCNINPSPQLHKRGRRGSARRPRSTCDAGPQDRFLCGEPENLLLDPTLRPRRPHQEPQPFISPDRPTRMSSRLPSITVSGEPNTSTFKGPETNATPHVKDRAIDRASKRRKIEQRDAEGATAHRGSVELDEDFGIISICSLYMGRNAGRFPRDLDIASIAELFRIDRGLVEAYCARFQSSRISQDEPPSSPSLGQSSLLPETVEVCKLWRMRNRHDVKQTPSSSELKNLASLFKDKDDLINNWFIRCQTNGQDSGYSSGNIASSQSDLNMRTRRKSCHKQDSAWPASHYDIPRSATKPYVCPYCGSPFSKARKGMWERHTNAAWGHMVWICKSPCQSTTRYTRLDSFQKHWNKHHSGETLNEEIYQHISPGNFDDRCFLKSCPSRLNSYEGMCDHYKDHMLNDVSWTYRDVRDEDEDNANLGNGVHDFDDSNGGNDTDRDEDGSDDDDDDPPAPSSGSSSTSRRPTTQGPGSSRPPGDQHDSSGARNPQGGSHRREHAEHAGRSTTDLVDDPHRFSLTDRTRHGTTSWSIGNGGNFKPTVPNPSIKFLGRLGSSDTSSVDEVRLRGCPRTIARKTISTSRPDSVLTANNEIRMMSHLQHPHVTELMFGDRAQASVTLMMNPVADYTLSQFLASCDTPRLERLGWPWLGCLAEALRYLHARGVWHRDVKPGNILVKDNEILFADFGSSTLMTSSGRELAHPYRCTALYAAPEVQQGRSSPQSDIFGLGCVFLEIATLLSSHDLASDMRRQQKAALQHSSHQSEWTHCWRNILAVATQSMTNKSRLVKLLSLCGDMLQSHPNVRPSALKVKQRVASELDSTCVHLVHVSVEDFVLRAPTKSYTWPLDRTVTQQRKNEDQFSRANTSQISYRQQSATSAWDFTLRRMQAGRSVLVTVDYETSSPDHSSRLSVQSTQSGIVDQNSNVDSFLQYPNTHEQFRVFGQATQAMVVRWVRLQAEPHINLSADEVSGMMTELSLLDGVEGDQMAR